MYDAMSPWSRWIGATLLIVALLAAGCVPPTGAPDPTLGPAEASTPTLAPEATATTPAPTPTTPAPPNAVAGPESEIVGVTWQWLRFESSDGSVLEVDDPSAYTLTLHPEGTYDLRADCNTGSGTYQPEEGGSLLLEAPVMTLIACPEGSLHDRFLSDLGYVRTFVVADGLLHLNLFADAGNMVFAPAE